SVYSTSSRLVRRSSVAVSIRRAGALNRGGRLCTVTTETINGTTLAYDMVGDGDPLILIHGSWGERPTWGFILPGLSESFRVISDDRRRHGERVCDPTAGTIADDVADAAAVIDGLAAWA